MKFENPYQDLCYTAIVVVVKIKSLCQHGSISSQVKTSITGCGRMPGGGSYSPTGGGGGDGRGGHDGCSGGHDGDVDGDDNIM